MNFYNEHDPKAAAWLRELIVGGHIAPGVVDERSIEDITPQELQSYTQCHFFAGIGGWSLALRLSGWPDDKPVWTGSCPCQPFSTAGRQKGNDDERHLWPAFFNLIRECRPNHVFGEQVANAIGHGWLDGISADLESEGYACGAAVLGAHSVGAPHIRQRLYWVANNQGKREGSESKSKQEGVLLVDGCGEVDGLAHANHGGLGKLQELDSKQEVNPANRDSQGGHSDGCGDSGRLGNPNSTRLEVGQKDGERAGEIASVKPPSPWSDSTHTYCRDGKVRRIPTEPSLFPLAHGVPGRVGLLRGSGNAIVPQVAAQFIQAAEAAFNHEMRTVCH
jgi:DNA (cytosine-5)-methyltransferase 1